MINVLNRGSRSKPNHAGQVRRAVGTNVRWTLIMACLLPLTAAFGGTIAVLFAPAFSGSLLITVLVILAVASSLVRSRLGALEDMEAEMALHGVAPSTGEMDPRT